MVATMASDPSGVEYYFDCTTAGGHDSGWQSGTSYTDTGLSPSTQYCYQVKARDSSPNLNETAYSTTECATTAQVDVDPPTPDPMTWATVPYATGPTSIAMVATTASDSSPPVEYYFDCTTAGGHDSGWQTSTSYEDTGLQCETQYTYRVQARDSVPNTGSFSTSESATTDTCPSEPDMYVNDIAMGCSQQAVFHRVTATVWIKDDTSANVEGATVYVEWTGDVSGTDSGTTLADGTVYFESAKVKNGLTATCCVTDVVKTGYVYNSSLNNETCDSNTCP